MGVGMAEPASTVPEVPAPVRGRAGWELALPGLIVFATAVCLAIFDGAFEPRIWYLPALFLLACWSWWASSCARRRSRVRGWSRRRSASTRRSWPGTTLSILWADIPGAAWEGANRALFYGVAMAIITAAPWRRGPATGVLALVAFGLGLQALAALVLTSTSDDLRRFFLEGRLNWPIEYANATADLWLIGLLPRALPRVVVLAALAAPRPGAGHGVPAAPDGRALAEPRRRGRVRRRGVPVHRLHARGGCTRC